jgi:hypothetical protein
MEERGNAGTGNIAAAMKGLYINIPDARDKIAGIDRVLGTGAALFEGQTGPWRVTANVHPADWPEGPVYHNPEADLWAAASGWLMYRGRLGNLKDFAADLVAALAARDFRRLETHLDAGAFVVFVVHRGVPALAADPFGLHPHYRSAANPFRCLAPSPWFIPGGRAPEPVQAAVLAKMNHGVGNLTAHADIVRLDPGTVLTSAGAYRYFRHERTDPAQPGEMLDSLRAGLDRFRGRPRILPISGGLDSRLILASGDYDYGYTFGPAATGDRPVARRYAGRFREYREFSLLDLDYPRELREAGARLFDGLCAAPFLELLAVYARLARAWGHGWFFDGYCGDVLLRGTFYRYGGPVGTLLKLLPVARPGGALELLRRRYARLDDREFAGVETAYQRHVAGLDLPELKKAALFELLYGRGARHALNGGTLLSGQFFSTAQPFFIPAVFRRLFALPPEDAVSYRAVQALYRELPEPVWRIPTYAGFSPAWNPHLSRLALLFFKGLAKTGVLPKANQFDVELDKVKWQ